jgi:hypothetical protein
MAEIPTAERPIKESAPVIFMLNHATDEIKMNYNDRIEDDATVRVMMLKNDSCASID